MGRLSFGAWIREPNQRANLPFKAETAALRHVKRDIRKRRVF
jgi:hypothetical protein